MDPRTSARRSLKLNWIASTTLSLIRMVESSTLVTDDPSGRVSIMRGSAKALPLKSDVSVKVFLTEADRILERLVSASLEPSAFWSHLVDDLVSHSGDEPLTPQICEVALLRAGHSQLQSEQTAAAVFRSLDTCRITLAGELPRMAEQLRLRYAPLKQAFEAYGPGMLRSIGNQIWNGAPPKGWWPNKVTVHAVQPLQSGAAGHSPHQSAVWIEAVLTDISPKVPEWLRLVYHLSELAIDTHTRTHASNSGIDTSGKSSSTELPWSLGIVPLVLDQAIDRGLLPTGLLPDGQMPIDEAIRLWRSSDTFENLLGPGIDDASLALLIQEWWLEVGMHTKAFPIALKELASRLDRSNSASNQGDV
ncbi:hypothetical protein SAMN06265222_102257 [Neorhodopirellula lusitana]|uniref:Uncharacterized protein n=1 Tax=Neorhodopirellula lusitana TaxID=445327 RepID=A0ABY1PUN1_9BACT|nr:hypothetical protein [Neorhodopirellula lusitana]SMP47181.1 hypothetical protein SAMN06265222_102257 [Neorhodopirellula lusitana]